MQGTTLPSESERALPAVAEQLVVRGDGLPAFQTRTCARCGRQTTFALQDRAGLLRLSGVWALRVAPTM